MSDTLEESCGGKLQQWATKVMGYSGSMSPQDWKQLCQDDLGKFWLNVINSTHPQRVVATVKRTLLSYPNLVTPQAQLPVAVKQRSDEWQSLVEQRNKLARERAALQNGIRLKNNEIDDIHAKLSSLEQDHKTSQDASVELVTRCSLLSSHVTSCDQWCQVIKEYQQRVKAHYDYLASHKGDEGSDVTFVVSKTTGQDTLESLTMHVVKDALFCIKQLLSVLADESLDKSTVQEAKGRAWKSVEELLGNHPLGDILQSLCNVATEAEKQLNSHTSNINLKQDTKQLRFRCLRENGELKDVSNQMSLLYTVCAHIKEAQIDHVNRSRSTEQSQLAVNNLQQKLASLQQQICKLLEKHYQGSPHLLQLNKNLMQLERELVGARAALQTLTSTESFLHEGCVQQQAILQELHQKQKRIEEYASRTASKQSKIELLIRQNSSAKHQLLKQRREVMSYAQQRVVSQHSMLVVSADHLIDTSDSESLLLNKLKLHCLPQYEINRADVVVNALGCRGYQPCELMLDKVVELLQKAEELKKELRVKQLNLNSIKLDTNLFEVHSRLMDDACQHAQEAVLPQLHNQLHRANSSVQQCVNIRSAISDWWAQPAQLLVPWVTQQGMNVNQWLEQWRCLLKNLE